MRWWTHLAMTVANLAFVGVHLARPTPNAHLVALNAFVAGFCAVGLILWWDEAWKWASRMVGDVRRN